MGARATETTQVSAKYINSSWIKKVEANHKLAEQEGNSFIREYVRQEAAFREVIEPQGVSDDELTRSVDTDEPIMVIEKEPKSFATFVELQGTPSARWFNGPRYAVPFGKITSDLFTKSKFQLMTYQNDIRKIIADNSVKDLADQEDRHGRKTCGQIINANPSVQRTTAPQFTSGGFKRAFQAMYDRRRPIGKLLMTQSLLTEAIDLPATAIGSEIASKHWREGIESEERLFGVPVISTIKSDIYDPRECWVFSPQNFLGNFFLLQDATLFIKQEADIIMFFTYEAVGIGIGNRLSIQQILFS